MPCSWCGQWIDTYDEHTLSQHMEYDAIREADGSDRVVVNAEGLAWFKRLHGDPIHRCYWWTITFPCRPFDKDWGLIGYLRCDPGLDNPIYVLIIPLSIMFLMIMTWAIISLAVIWLGHRCVACRQPADDDEPSPRPMHHEDERVQNKVADGSWLDQRPMNEADRAAGRPRRSISPTDAEAPGCRW